jgi:hypothetical protein
MKILLQWVGAILMLSWLLPWVFATVDILSWILTGSALTSVPWNPFSVLVLVLYSLLAGFLGGFALAFAEI